MAVRWQPDRDPRVQKKPQRTQKGTTVMWLRCTAREIGLNERDGLLVWDIEDDTISQDAEVCGQCGQRWNIFGGGLAFEQATSS